MATLAVLILTYNEEPNIEACMSSVSFANEIVVVDSCSTDHTVNIAQALGAKVMQKTMNEGFAAQRNFALEHTQADWVLYLDADERILPELAVEIRKLVDEGPLVAYEILRQNVVFGKRIHYGGHKPDWSRRLYPRTAIRWQGLVHEAACVTVPIKKCKNPMLHYTYTSWDKYFEKVNKYTSLMAQQYQQEKRRISFFDILLRPIYGFIRMYFLKLGFLDGKLGFILAVLHGYYTFVKYIKLDTLTREITEKAE